MEYLFYIYDNILKIKGKTISFKDRKPILKTSSFFPTTKYIFYTGDGILCDEYF